MTMLVHGGHDTSSQVWLASRVAYSSSIARRQCGSARVVRTEEGTGEVSVAHNAAPPCPSTAHLRPNVVAASPLQIPCGKL
jgi:hypothetical protein